MLHGELTAEFVVDDHRAHGVVLQLGANHRRGYAALLHVRDQVYIEEQPVSENDETFDAPVEHHLQIALKTATFVMDIGKDGKKVGLIERILDPAKDEGTVGIGHI